MENTLLQLDDDEERFRKLQQSDQTNFEDRLDGLQVCLHYRHVKLASKLGQIGPKRDKSGTF